MRSAFVLALVLGWCSLAWAQDDTHFRRGVELYQRGDYRGALTEFEAQYGASPTPALLYNLGRTLERLGRNAEAVSRYSEFLDAGSPGMTPGARSELVGHVRELRERLCELTVQGQPGLYVTVNGVPMGTIPTVITLDPGAYTIVAGHARQEVQLTAADRRTVYLEEPSSGGGGGTAGEGTGGGGGGGGTGGGSGTGTGTGTGTGVGTGSGTGTGTGTGGPGTGAWIALGIGGTAIVTAIITGVVALGKESEADDIARDLEDETDPDRREQLARDGLDANSAGRTYAAVADISLVAAAVAGGVFTYLVMSSGSDGPPPDAGTTAVTSAVIPGGAMVTARGVW